ncbi:hypothetical protein E8E13_000594 [Curvularia kusanoi]|uniref:Uncharacterized protein n=1 Tax=Curvularia kusanoi TaxID=90978 RepID=A0A9P4T872_CURKU|nr:hypothetical protein E8E13_000594 [Curvularia kusanoi]
MKISPKSKDLDLKASVRGGGRLANSSVAFANLEAFMMAKRQCQQPDVLLVFRVLQFVGQLRRRVQPRTQRGFVDDPRSNSKVSTNRTTSRRFSEGLSRLGIRRDAKQPQYIANRISKSRRHNHKPVITRPRASGADDSDRSNEAGGEVQHVLSSVDDIYGPFEHVLSAVASDNKLFLKHSNSPILEGRSLDDIVQLLVTAYEASQTLSYCRSQFSDRWLAAQGKSLGLDIDETFIANYEHLLLWLQMELVDVLARKGLEELLHPTGGYDKKQQKLLSWFTEFAEKPRPLSTSFPWTIKSSLAVLWGVCWMFYNPLEQTPADADGNHRIPGSRVLQHVDVPWAAPGPSEYQQFGLQLIGSQSQPEVRQQTGDNLPVGPQSDVFDAARNTDTWTPDWQHGGSRHPSLTEAQLTPIGLLSPAAPRTLLG